MSMEGGGRFPFWALCLCLSAFSGSSLAELQARCPVYVEEGYSLTCSCIYQVDHIPTQSPSFSWVGHSDDRNLKKHRVDRSDNGTVFTCVMVMGGQTFSVNYTLQVVYGPSESDVTITPQQPILLNGSNPVTLTCLATEVNPQPTFTWTGLTCAEGNQGDTCTFTPTLPQDNNKQVTCTVKNSQLTGSDNTVSKTLTLTFNHSPSPTTTKATPSTTLMTTKKTTGGSTVQPPATSSSSPPPATSAVSTTTEVRPVAEGDRFPIVAFAGGMAGAFLLILILIIIIVLCQRKKERDLSLTRSAEFQNGSYRNSTTKDFYMFDNNGFDHDPVTGTQDNLNNDHHHHHHTPNPLFSQSKPSSRQADVERALVFYQSVPDTSADPDQSVPDTSADPDQSVPDTSADHDQSVPDTSADHDQSVPDTSADPDQSVPGTSADPDQSVPDTSADPAASTHPQAAPEGAGNNATPLGGTTWRVPREGDRSVEVVRFENPSYRLAAPSPSTGTPGTQTVKVGPQNRPNEGTQPAMRTQLDKGTQPFWKAPAEQGTPSDSGTEADWALPPSSKAPGGDNVGNGVYAEVSKPCPAAPTDDTEPDRDLNHIVGPLGDVYARPQHHEGPQQVEVTTRPSGTLITITNNHNVPEDEGDTLEDGFVRLN